MNIKKRLEALEKQQSHDDEPITITRTIIEANGERGETLVFNRETKQWEPVSA